MADVQMFPAPPSPVGTTRNAVAKKEGRPSPANQKFYAEHLSGRGVRANFELPAQVSEQEQRLASHVHHLFSIARTNRRNRVADWRRWDQILSNRTWLNGRAAYLPSPEIPEAYAILATLVAYIGDSRPSFEAAPAMMPMSSNYDFFQQNCWDLQTVAESVLHNYSTEKEIERCTWDAYRYGTGVLKTTWDQSLDGGLGNVRINRVNPYNFYPDPNASDENDGNYYIEVRTMSMQELDRRFPGAANKLNPVALDNDDPTDPDNPQATGVMANPGAITGTGFDGQSAPNTPAAFGRPGQARDAIGDVAFADKVTVVEAWVRQHKHGPSPVPDEYSPTATVESWRCVVVVGNRVLLDADAVDLYGHADHPFSRFVQHETTASFWGQSMAALLAPCQMALNRTFAAIQHNLDLLGNPVLMETARANIDRSTITNKPGQRLRVGDGGNVEWLSPPPVHPLHLQMIDTYISEMERISGLNAVSRGGSPTGRNSADVMNAAQESGFVRVRMALRNLENTLRNAFLKMGNLIVQNYTAPRMVAIVGESGERTSLALRSRHFTMPSDKGAIPLRFQILVNAGSGLPVSRQAMLEEANFLFSVGAIDRQALLEVHRFPHWREVLERVTAYEASGMGQQPDSRTATRA
jgi:hypothetical protein